VCGQTVMDSTMACPTHYHDLSGIQTSSQIDIQPTVQQGLWLYSSVYLTRILT
jgi:hypothetical protein